MSTPAPGDLSGDRILVTGGSGFIGRHVVTELAGAGADVRVIDLQPHPDPSVDIVIGDLAEPEVIEASLEGGIDSIVHLAAVTSVLKSLEQPELTQRTNVTATAALLEAARVAGVKNLVFTSTNAVVGPMEGPAISESSRLRPLTPYGATKAAAEMLMSAYTETLGVRCVPLRLTNAYGPGMQAKDSIVARLMRAIRTGATFEIYGDGTQVRDYVHVRDIVAAMRLALADESWRGPTVIGSGTSLSVLEVVAAVEEVSGATIPVRHGPAKPGEMPAVIVDNSRARAAGWSPRYDLAGGLVGVWEEWSTADLAVLAAPR
ncbi:MAG TPA: NAD-dependent epimerase/dehydratase family protein [Solirubrobacteraceae bacterium]|nr:NAD-dependent epimerase/dehydratase family protein [Solirubrobacteraceae bacterium]